MTTPRYKSMDTDPSVISAWDIRSGKSAGGLAGSLTFYKNMASTATYDRATGTGGLAGLDIYDTIDDYNNGAGFPTQNPGGWVQATGANWLRDPASDTDTSGTCNGGEDCVYKDQITGMDWAKDDGVSRTWEAAITYCDGLNAAHSGAGFGGYTTGWRLPTQKELMQSYTDGIASQNSTLSLATIYHWSASKATIATTYAWATFLGDGYTYYYNESNNEAVLCVRP